MSGIGRSQGTFSALAQAAAGDVERESQDSMVVAFAGSLGEESRCSIHARHLPSFHGQDREGRRTDGGGRETMAERNARNVLKQLHRAGNERMENLGKVMAALTLLRVRGVRANERKQMRAERLTAAGGR